MVDCGEQMKQTKKNLILVAGVISTVLGVVWAIPSFLKGLYGVAIGASLLLVFGLVLIAIAFGD